MHKEYNTKDTEFTRMKNRVRNRKSWKELQDLKRTEQNSKCFITGSKLSKTANLHHLRISTEEAEYSNLSPERFIYMNNDAHDVWHSIYRSKCGWQHYISMLIKSFRMADDLNGKPYITNEGE